MVGCAGNSTDSLSAWCAGGPPVNFGVQTLHGLSGSVRSADGPVVNARVRWRASGKSMIATRQWQSGATDQSGRFFATDLEPGRWELEICGTGYRPIAGVVVIDETSPALQIELSTEKTP